MDNLSEMMLVCRLCLVKDQLNVPIFPDEGDLREILIKLRSCLPSLKIKPDDKLPKKICDNCSYKLDMLYEFYNTAVNAEKTLLSWLDQAGVKHSEAEEAMTAVAQQAAAVKQEAGNDDDDDEDYMKLSSFQQKLSYEEGAAAGPSATATSDEPPRKRQRRTAAVKAQISIQPESDDDEDMSGAEPATKLEEESEESDNEGERETAFVDVLSGSGGAGDDQPGPSGVGKEGVEAPLFDLLSYAPKRRPRQSRTYYCKTCDVEMKMEERYRHKYHVHKREEFCHVCGVPSRNLREHLRTHSDERPFECDVCGKAFRQRKRWYVHKRIHLPESKYECPVCGKGFKVKYNMRVHARIHDDVKPFECDVCHKTFTTKQWRNSHMGTHFKGDGRRPHEGCWA